MKKAVFLDKDGTLIEDIAYNADPAKVKLTDNAVKALKLLKNHHFIFVVVSNQSGVGKGFFSENDVRDVFRRIEDILSMDDLQILRFYFCPHDQQICDCKKPKPGMILQAARELSIDLSRSWMIGDILDDVEAGNRAGCRSILIDNHHETEWKMSTDRRPFVKAKDLLNAAEVIVANDPGL